MEARHARTRRKLHARSASEVFDCLRQIVCGYAPGNHVAARCCRSKGRARGIWCERWHPAFGSGRPEFIGRRRWRRCRMRSEFAAGPGWLPFLNKPERCLLSARFEQPGEEGSCRAFSQEREGMAYLANRKRRVQVSMKGLNSVRGKRAAKMCPGNRGHLDRWDAKLHETS